MFPLLIGCIIPVSILINVPSITSPWVGLASYNDTIQDWDEPEVLQIPHWLNAIIILAFVMAIICNICVLFRFLERHVYHSVILSLVTATIQDALCIAAVVPFCILYPPSKGYVYLEGFWSMVASIFFSFLATILISIDLHWTPNFRLQGSGVTHKQRILIAEAMSLCFYLAIGALIFIYLEDWTFLDALFFVMVTITTIGFGDRVPQTAGGRIFVVFYAAGGIVLLALSVNAIRYVILEDLHRRFAIRSKERKAKRDARRQERRDQRAHQEEQRQRLQEAMELSESPAGSGTTTPIGAPKAKPNLSDTASDSYYLTHFSRHFNITHGNQPRLPSTFTRSVSASESRPTGSADTRRQGELDATLPGDSPQDAIEMLRTRGSHISREGGEEQEPAGSNTGRESPGSPLRRNRYIVDDDLLRYATIHPRQTYTSNRVRSWLDRLWFFRRPPAQDDDDEEATQQRTLEATQQPTLEATQQPTLEATQQPTLEATQQLTSEEQRQADKKQVYKESMKEYQRRLRFSAAVFLTFWLLGAVIFTFVESWGFGASMYFVFIAFSTIGYGDLVPRTIAGRSIFMAYCLIGVVTLTWLASLISEVLSKSMRKHVVETQLRRSELLEALGDERGGRRGDGIDLVHGTSQDDTDDARFQNERVPDTDRSGNSAVGATETAPEDKTCHGTLHNLVKVSEGFDEMLRKILGLEHTDEERWVITSPKSQPPSPTFPNSPNPDEIVSYLEMEEDESEPSFLSPSISRDITSTSTIHRHLLRPMMHQRQHSHDPHIGGTYHGSSQGNSNQLKITAWPTIGAPSNVAQRGQEHGRPRIQTSAPQPVLSPVFLPASTSVPVHQNTKDDVITIPAVQWQSLIEYSKRFKALMVACEEAMQKVAEWEASEKRLRQKRYEARLRQKHLFDERRRRLHQLGGTHGAAEDDIDDEEELEELDEWDEEGSDNDEDDGDMDMQRAQIAAKLLGPPADLPRARSSPVRLRRQSISSIGHLGNDNSPRPHSQQLRAPSVPLVRTLHAHLRHYHPKKRERQQAPRHHQHPEQSQAEQVIESRRSAPTESLSPCRSESPKPLEIPATNPSKDDTVGSPSSSAQSDQRLPSPSYRPSSPKIF
ncbi:hypothetical protein BGX23_012406 [Mortierella sp. AD031]|nr:hypothetical protein BGX23_012406 [Mortierella sp. AD031]